jgi:hypothetical protein
MRDSDNTASVARDDVDLLSDLEKLIAKRRIAAAAPASRAGPEKLPARDDSADLCDFDDRLPTTLPPAAVVRLNCQQRVAAGFER